MKKKRINILVKPLFKYPSLIFDDLDLLESLLDEELEADLDLDLDLGLLCLDR